MRVTISEGGGRHKDELEVCAENADDRSWPSTGRLSLNSEPTPPLASHLTDLLGVDPAGLDWPREFEVAGAGGVQMGVYDPHNSLLVVYGARPADLDATGLAACWAAGKGKSDLCSRLLVYAPAGRAEAWRSLGFRLEGTIGGYWADGGEARLWARSCDRRATEPRDRESTAPLPRKSSGWPSGCVCRPAVPDDATDLSALLRAVFPDYPTPVDPGVIRYALASGGVHGRLVCDRQGRPTAYASAEFRSAEGSVEITDCATEPRWRRRGLMTHLVERLQEDLVDVFARDRAHALARVDQPAIRGVFARLGWQRTGRLINHFRVGARWVSAELWEAPQPENPDPPAR